MTSLPEEEHLYSLWHTMGIHQATFITITFIIAIIIGFMIATLFYSRYFNKHWQGFYSILAGILGALGCCVLFSCYLLFCGGNSQVDNLSPATVAKQNIKIIKDKRKLPKLKRLANHYNNKYMYCAHRADDNLEKRAPSNHYEHLFYKTKSRINNIKSLMSYSDPKQQAVTKHGGLHHIRKPRTSDIFMPRRYSFKMSKYEHILKEYGEN